MDVEKALTIILEDWYQEMKNYVIENKLPLKHTIKINEIDHNISFGMNRFSVHAGNFSYSSYSITEELLVNAKNIIDSIEAYIKALPTNVNQLNEATKLLESAATLLPSDTIQGYSKIKNGDIYIGIIKEGVKCNYFIEKKSGTRAILDWPKSSSRENEEADILTNFSALKKHAMTKSNWALFDEMEWESFQNIVSGLLIKSTKEETVFTLEDNEIKYTGNALSFNNAPINVQNVRYYYGKNLDIDDKVFIIKNQDTIIDWLKAQRKRKTYIKPAQTGTTKKTSSGYTKSMSKEAKQLLEYARTVLTMERIADTFPRNKRTIPIKSKDINIELRCTDFEYSRTLKNNGYIKVNGIKLGWPYRNNGTREFVSVKHKENAKLWSKWDDYKVMIKDAITAAEKDTKDHNAKMENLVREDFKERLLVAVLDNKLSLS